MGYFILRITAGFLMFWSHGYPKLMNFSEMSLNFPDPIGLGSPLSLALVVFAECFCAFFIAIGLFTRLSALPLIITMAVAAFVIHGGDPLAKKELSLIYLAMYLCIFLSGPGRYGVGQRFVRNDIWFIQ